MWESFISFFEDAPTWFRSGLLVGGLAFFWILEGIIPMFRVSYKKWRHGIRNVFFNLTTAIIGLGLAFSLLQASLFAEKHQIGVLHWLEIPLWADVIIGVMLLDLIGAWLVHFTEHKVKFMWKFHIIHHSDTHVDATTGLRHHPGETVFRIAFTTLGILISGASMGIVVLYQSLSVFFAHLTHANIRLPHWLETPLSYIFVTPEKHKVHHHFQQPLSDTNYGNIFLLWDRLFGTYAYCPPEDIRYGLDTHMDPKEHENLKNLLHIPFQPYRSPEKLNQKDQVNIEEVKAV